MEGSEQQPGQAAPGWYPSPDGEGQRYWDGARWTEHSLSEPSAAGAPAKKQRNWLKGCLLISLGVALGGALLIGGCLAILGSAVDEAEDAQNRSGITLREFRSIEQGTRQQAVESQLGEPEDSQEFEQQIPELQDRPARSSCIYYPERGKEIFEGRSFQFCFDEGRLTSKNAY